jgi:NitT/TauT family transport system permease protein/sulfonate transport system permease protein
MAKTATESTIWDSTAANLFILSVLGIWHAASMVLPPFLLPSPWRVTQSLVQLLTTHDGVQHICVTLMHVLAAMLVSFTIATILALLPFYFPLFRLAVDGRITPFLNCFPAIGWTMVAIMWMGIGPQTVIFSVSIILLPFMVINLREGIASLDNELLEMGRSFTRNQWLVLLRIIVPLLMPFVLAAVRVSFGVAWKVVLTSELLGGGDGLGYLMNVARQELNTPDVVSIIILIILLVFLTNRLIFVPLQDKLGTIRR